MGGDTGRLDESFYEAIQFLKSLETIEEVKTVIAGEIRVVKKDGASILAFRSALIRAAQIVDGRTIFPTIVEEDPEFHERVGFSSSLNKSENACLYTFDESGVYARMRSV